LLARGPGGAMLPPVGELARRRFLSGGLALAALGLTAGCDRRLPWQPPARVPRLGYLGVGAIGPNVLLVEAFRQGLRDLGYVEGQSIAIEYRFMDGRMEQAPALAAELVALEVDLIVTAGGEATAAARDATATIPIVGAMLGSVPVQSGLVAGLARPGGNVTGVSGLAAGYAGKLLQLLAEAFSSAESVAILWNARNAQKAAQLGEAQEAAPGLGLQLRSVEVRGDGDFEGAFGAIAAARVDALLVLQEPLMAANSARIVAFALEQRLPAIYEVRLFTDAGGLMSYGVKHLERYHRAATYVDRILKGAKPADLPVEQPTELDFVINLRTARAIGVTIPPSVLARATEVIQ
jgi:putative ABC transport system substrate-binding protein